MARSDRRARLVRRFGWTGAVVMTSYLGLVVAGLSGVASVPAVTLPPFDSGNRSPATTSLAPAPTAATVPPSPLARTTIPVALPGPISGVSRSPNPPGVEPPGGSAAAVVPVVTSRDPAGLAPGQGQGRGQPTTIGKLTSKPMPPNR